MSKYWPQIEAYVHWKHEKKPAAFNRNSNKLHTKTVVHVELKMFRTGFFSSCLTISAEEEILDGKP